MANYITKIRRIKNLGLVFSNYSWGTGPQGKKLKDLPNFKQYNFIYGFNGSGKTTLSRLLNILEKPNVKELTVLGNLDYRIELEGGEQYTRRDSFPNKVRVFNRDYIDKNIKIQENIANSISIILGKINKELLSQIEEDERLLEESEPILKDYEKDQEKINQEHNSIFVNVAKIIESGILSDYYEDEAKKDFYNFREKGLLGNKGRMKNKERKKCLTFIKEESLGRISHIMSPVRRNRVLNNVGSVHRKSQELLIRTVDSKVMDRLAKNTDIANWVEKGVKLHKNSDVCEYCRNNISEDRIKELLSHFNQADRELKEEIDDAIQKLKKAQGIVEEINIPDKMRFYKELQDNIEEQGENFESAREKFITDIQDLCLMLEHKKSRTTEPIEFDRIFDMVGFLYLDSCINDISYTISRHNRRTMNFSEERKKVKQKLKIQYLSEIYDEVVVKENSLNELKNKINSFNQRIDEIQNRINKNRRKIISEEKACNYINKNLKEFLGHEEIRFEPHKDDNSGKVISYDILRKGDPVKDLSEGEKTAIALAYFLVHLKDQDFDTSNGIIVVDDPISSLDSNFLYQAFSFLKDAMQEVTKEGSQVFVLTHHFGFLRLLLNWKKYKRNKNNTGYYMIKNFYDSSHDRKAYIDKMDKELREYESEYHYLFKLLKEQKGELDKDSSIANAYPLPNIVRKVWESFLMYRVPNGEGSYEKMKELEKSDSISDKKKLDYIHRFVNRQSHINGSDFDPAVIEEAKKVIKAMFEVMEETAPEHFKIINRVTQDEVAQNKLTQN